MAYKYKKTQIFNRHLPAPKEVRERVYNNRATIQDVIDYDLVDKIPLQCLDYSYRQIAEVVGMEKAVSLDWDCIHALGTNVSTELREWFKDKVALSLEQLNASFYNLIKEKYIQILQNRFPDYSDPFTRSLLGQPRARDEQGSFGSFHFERFGKKFSEALPELLYVNDFYPAQTLFTKQLFLPYYIRDYDEYQKVPTDFLKQAFFREADRKLFAFLASYITDSSNFKADELVFNIVFSPNSYEPEKYLKILEKNPKIDVHLFLEQAYLQKLEDNLSRRPSTDDIIRYNIKKCEKLTLGQDGSLDILTFVDQKPEYSMIVKQFLNDTLRVAANIGHYDSAEEFIAYLIMQYHLYYDESLPEKFKTAYPELFLNTENVDLKQRFYHRTLRPGDFIEYPYLLTCFEKLDIASYLDGKYRFIFDDGGHIGLSRLEKLKLGTMYEEINDDSLQAIFKEHVLNSKQPVSLDNVRFLADVLYKIVYSNSSEMQAFKTIIAQQVLQTYDPLRNLERIEDIFLRNNLPVVGKLFSVFQILYPNVSGFDFSEQSKVSPVLRRHSTRGREAIIFADLLKATFGSNNRSMKAYLDNIEQGNKLFLEIASSNTSVVQLDADAKQILSTFMAHLNTLYNNTVVGKRKENLLSGNMEQDLKQLQYLFSENGKTAVSLPDRIIKMFGHFAGLDTFDQAKEYLTQKRVSADLKNRKNSSEALVLKPGDFIKGIGKIDYLYNILQNGSVAKEFLGDSATSDGTPLDTDLSRIMELGTDFRDTINKTIASGYGPIWLVLKNDDRFVITRNDAGENVPMDHFDLASDKLEAFCVTNGHYGIRTGFASSEIDFIVTRDIGSRVGLLIAMNGFYIPVVDQTGKLIFTADDYDEIRQKMAGLSYFDAGEYQFAKSLSSPLVAEFADRMHSDEVEVTHKRAAINHVISKAMNTVGLKLKTVIDGDLSEGSVELIDTGSTGRGTNIPGTGDFDFIMRLDKKIISDPSKLQVVKEALLSHLGKENTSEVTGTGDFRLKETTIEGLDSTVDIDITFMVKTDKLNYSTEMCLADRLATIKAQSKENYPLVLSNILLAKKVLKDAGVYKPKRGENPQGGLGGVGIENWVLEHGGSFVEAATSFLSTAEGKTFEEFKERYSVWDFGENHFAHRNGLFPHDDFVRNNMDEYGYQKMCKALKGYLKQSSYRPLETVQKEGRKL